MPLNVRVSGDVVILSNFGRFMNDPRYVDAGRDAAELMDQGFKRFVLDLGGVKETGGSLLGMLMTFTRTVRQRGGDVVLAHLSQDAEKFLESMRMDDYWDVFPTVEEATRFLMRGSEKTS
jgi:anti-anti-sigma regulatory factor